MYCKIDCPICGVRLSLLVERIDEYSYCYCKACGLIMSDPIPTTKQLEVFYENYFFRKPLDKECFEAKKREIYLDVEKITRDVKEYTKTVNKTLLDYGGGTGFYSKAFSEHGFNVTFFDFDKKVCEYTRQHFPNSFEIISSNLPDELVNRRFDVVFCNHVVEHLCDINAFLRGIRGVLNSEGLAIFCTVNQNNKEFYFRPIWVYYYLRKTIKSIINLRNLFVFFKKPWIACDPPRHNLAFNPQNLTLCLEKNGFSVLRIFTEYSTESYYSGRQHGISKVTNLKEMLRFFYGLLVHLGVFFLKFLDKRRLWGDNLVVFARPSD